MLANIKMLLTTRVLPAWVPLRIGLGLWLASINIYVLAIVKTNPQTEMLVTDFDGIQIYAIQTNALPIPLKVTAGKGKILHALLYKSIKFLVDTWAGWCIIPFKMKIR